MVVIPINQRDYHWSLLVVFNPGAIGMVSNFTGNRCINLTDSEELAVIVGFDSTCSGINKPASRKVRNWLNSMYSSKQKKGQKDWYTIKTMPLIEPRLPWQRDGWNCGIYVLKFMSLLHRSDVTLRMTYKDIKDEGEKISKICKFKNPEEINTLQFQYRNELQQRMRACRNVNTIEFDGFFAHRY